MGGLAKRTRSPGLSCSCAVGKITLAQLWGVSPKSQQVGLSCLGNQTGSLGHLGRGSRLVPQGYGASPPTHFPTLTPHCVPPLGYGMQP